MANRPNVTVAQERIAFLYSIGIRDEEEIVWILQTSSRIVKRDLRNALAASHELVPTDGIEAKAADAYAAAICGELEFDHETTRRLIAALGDKPNPLYVPKLQERIQRMKTGLAAKTAEVDRLKDVLGDIQRATNATIRENHPRRWNENLYKRCDELDLSIRAANCLHNAGIEFIWNVCEKTEPEMLKTSNFGRKSVNEIKAELAKLGLELGMKLDGFPRKKA